MDIQDIPEWAIEEACKRANNNWDKYILYTPAGVTSVIEDRSLHPIIMVAAECIAKYEKPPVLPLEMKAREAYIEAIGLSKEVDKDRCEQILREGPESGGPIFGAHLKLIWRGIRIALDLPLEIR